METLFAKIIYVANNFKKKLFMALTCKCSFMYFILIHAAMIIGKSNIILIILEKFFRTKNWNMKRSLLNVIEIK